MLDVNKVHRMECYDINDIMSRLPLHYDLLFNVRIERYGFLHDVGFKVILSPNHDGYGHGWETFEKDFADELEHCKQCWEIAAEYSYH